MSNLPDNLKRSTVVADKDAQSSISQDSKTADLIFTVKLGSAMNTKTLLAPETIKKAEYIPEGTVINGRYTVDKILGEGGMGVVYKVTDKLNLERILALKTLRAANISEEQLAMFQAEFKTMSKLYHPNVASVYDFEPIQGTEDYLFTLDFVKGKELDESIEGKDLKDILELLVQVCRALSYMHSRKIIHFDLKPQNVLVDMDGNAKVLDFGIAGAKQIAGSGGGLVGTPHYMAPEIVLDRSMVDHRFDLYSLGIMIFKLFVGNVPYTATTLRELIKLHCFQRLEFDDEAKKKMPGWLIDLVNRLCEKNPVDRFRSANAVIEFINKEGGFSYEVETQETRESYILSTRFVGRKKEFSHVTGFIDNRLKGQDVAGGPIVFVVGQSGIGKSRLLREVCYHSQLSGNLFIEGNCYEGVASEYGPVAEILGYLVALAQASGSTELLNDYAQSLIKIEPKLSTTLETKPVESSGDTAAEKLALMEDISSFILRLSDVVPFALYINDLQWARSGTTDILSYIAMRIHQKELVQKTQLALLGSFRDDEIEGKPILKLLELVKVEVITLGVLGSGEVKLLLCSMLGVEELPQEFVNRVVEETAGNPFFVESVMRVLVENGTVYLENGEWAADADVGELEIPSIDDVFLRRVSLLDDAQRTVLEVIAVCGLPTSPTVINQVCQMDSDTFHQALTILMQRQMVKRRDGTEIRYQTNHDWMRKTVYQNLEPERLKELHQGIAKAIESIYESELEPHIANLARHYYRTDNKEKALKYCLAAGDMAKEQYANELGIEMYQHVLDLLPQEEAESRFKAEVTEKLADLYFNIGDYPKSESYYNQVLAQRKEKDVQYRINNMISNIYISKGEILKALDFSLTALSILGYSFPKTKIGIMVNLMGTMFVHMFHSMFPWLVRTVKKEKKRKKLLDVVEMYRSFCHIYWAINPNGLMLSAFRASNVSDKIGISPQTVIAYSCVALMYSVLTFYRRSIKFLNKASKICEHIEHPLAQCYLTEYEGIIRLYMAQWQRSLDVSLQAKELLKKLGNMEYLSIAYTNLFYSNYYKGDIKAAYEECLDGYQILERSGSMKYGRVILEGLCVSGALLGDDIDDVMKRLDQCISDCKKANDEFIAACGQTLAGDILFAADRIDQSIDYLEQAQEIRERDSLPQDYLVFIYPLLARAYMEKIRTDSNLNKKEQKRLRKLSKKNVRKSLFLTKIVGHPNFLSQSYLNKGTFNWLSGKKKKARKFFQLSMQTAEKLGSDIQLASSYFEAGRCMAEDGGKDAELCQEYLQKALKLYEKCETTLWISHMKNVLGDNMPQ